MGGEEKSLLAARHAQITNNNKSLLSTCVWVLWFGTLKNERHVVVAERLDVSIAFLYVDSDGRRMARNLTLF